MRFCLFYVWFFFIVVYLSICFHFNRKLPFEKYSKMLSGANPGFQIRGDALKKIAPSGGRCENFGGISCEKITILLQKKSYFSNFRGGARNFWGISCEKSRFYAKKIIFFPILGGGARRVRPPLNPPLIFIKFIKFTTYETVLI